MADEAPKSLGRYEIVRELGKGAMGIVYEGRDPNIGRRVAIKTARRDVLEASGRADELMERFLREAQAAGSLNHPNIITIYDADEENGIAYIAMEFHEGGDLEEYIENHKFIEEEKTVEICATLCTALAVAHRQGIVHRDIKPANVMIQGDDIKIADFGIAHVSDSNLTQEGAMIGTPHYMSPEGFQGRKVDGRSDLFSAAIMTYEMLTNEKPFTGEALSTVMTAVIKSTPIEPQELNSSVTPTLSDVVMKALSKNPNQRYQTGDEMAAALRESLKPNPDPAVTQLVDPGDAATVVTNAPVDATVIGDGAPFEGTVAGEAPVSEAEGAEAEGAEATPEGAPAPSVPPVSEKRAEAPPPPEVERALAEPEAKRGFPTGVILGAGAVVVVLGILAVMMYSSGEPPSGDVPYISKVTVTGILFPDGESYLEWSDDWENIPWDIAKKAQGAMVLVKAGGVQVANGFLDEDGTVTLGIDDKPETLEIELSLLGYDLGEANLMATHEDHKFEAKLALIKEPEDSQ